MHTYLLLLRDTLFRSYIEEMEHNNNGPILARKLKESLTKETDIFFKDQALKKKIKKEKVTDDHNK